MRQADHSDGGFVWLVRTDLDIVLSLHVPEECPYVLQRLFGVFALQPKIRGHVTKEKSQKSKMMNTQEQR